MKPDIIIKQLDNGCFDVHVGDKSTEDVTFEEMLGVITQLLIPDNKRLLQWLKTKEEHNKIWNRNKGGGNTTNG